MVRPISTKFSLYYLLRTRMAYFGFYLPSELLLSRTSRFIKKFDAQEFLVLYVYLCRRRLTFYWHCSVSFTLILYLFLLISTFCLLPLLWWIKFIKTFAVSSSSFKFIYLVGTVWFSNVCKCHRDWLKFRIAFVLAAY